MNQFAVKEAAALLGVSDDTVRRWGDAGKLRIHKAPGGRQVIEGADLLPLLREPETASALAAAFPLAKASARNRFTGIVTESAGWGDGAGRHPGRSVPSRLADVAGGGRRPGTRTGDARGRER
jgi:excisionase family DNA binding protein